MRAATWPRDEPLDERLLLVDGRTDRYDDARVGDLARVLRAGDLVVLNDAATIPASLEGRTARGVCVEARLVAEGVDGAWQAVLFGDGSWRTRTEDRAAPPALAVGDALVFSRAPSADATLTAHVVDVSAISPRLVTLRFDAHDAELWSALYRIGRPVQYAYVTAPLELWHVQTPYASRPWAVEMPSAGRPLRASLLRSLTTAGVGVATITHAAGLSSTGDPAIDAALPLPERFDVPAATVDAVERTRARASESGGRVIAVGTTVVRALEGSARLHGDALVAGAGTTDFRIDHAFVPRVVDALFTGLHEPTASHFRLLEAFAPVALLERAYAHAVRSGYVCHEFGDSSLIVRNPARRAARDARE